MSKFGRVYHKSKNSDKLELQSSLRFSNLDHTLHDFEGKLNSKSETTYNGRKFSLRFRITQNDKKGLPVQFEGSFQLPYKFGEIAAQDFDGVSLAEKEDYELVQRFNLLSDKYTAEELERTFGQAAFLASIYPGFKLKNLIQRNYNLSFFAFDDYMEKIAVDLTNDQCNYFFKSSFDKHDAENLEPTIPDLPEVLLNFVKYIQYCNEELINAECEPGVGKYLRKACEEYIQAVCLENCAEWKKKQNELPDTTLEELRYVVSGAWLVLENCLFDTRIHIREEIRNTFLFKYYVKLYAQQVCWVNDIISYRKEMESGQAGYGSNKVSLFHYNQGLTLQDAMQQALEKANHNTTLIVKTGKILSKLYEKDDHVQRFVMDVRDIVYGHIQWCTYSERYHKDFAYDIIFDFDDEI